MSMMWHRGGGGGAGGLTVKEKRKESFPFNNKSLLLNLLNPSGQHIRIIERTENSERKIIFLSLYTHPITGGVTILQRRNNVAALKRLFEKIPGTGCSKHR